MPEQQKQKILTLYFTLEEYMQEYRKSLLWLTYGDHRAVPHPTKQETRQAVERLQDNIFRLLTEIEAETQGS